MALNRLNPTLMENVVTMLCHSDDYGRLVAQMVNPNLFEGDFRIIAERATDFWAIHKQAPKFHTADLIADILENKSDRRGNTLRTMLMSMASLAPDLNTDYVIDQLTKFVRLQKMKDTILKSAERLNAQQDMAIGEVEDMWNEILRTRELGFDPGIRLSDVDRLLSFLHSREREFDIGIPHLDDRNAVPMRGNILLILAGAGLGKSWALINLGKRALAQRKKVVHVTLELSEEMTLQRYYQSLFSIAKRIPEDGIYLANVTIEDKKIQDVWSEAFEPPFTFRSKSIKADLATQMKWLGARLSNVIIKQFPSKYLTPNFLRAYLDNLEITEKFIPDLVIIDYLKEMAIDDKNYRISLDHTFSELRAIGVERNCAVATAQQLSKAGVEAAIAKSTHVAEAWALIGTTDVCLTYACTTWERTAGLARLYVSKNREDEDQYGVLLTQNYAVGQFVLNSWPMPEKYLEYVNEQVTNKEA